MYMFPIQIMIVNHDLFGGFSVKCVLMQCSWFHRSNDGSHIHRERPCHVPEGLHQGRGEQAGAG